MCMNVNKQKFTTWMMGKLHIFCFYILEIYKEGRMKFFSISPPFKFRSECMCWMYLLPKYPDDLIENNILLSDYECTPDNLYIPPRDRPKSGPKQIDDLKYYHNTRC